jgi:uncharacterized protein (TIGR03067 family)
MLTGTWIPTQAELAGAAVTDHEIRNIRLLLSADHYKAYIGRQVDFGTLKVDKTTRPKRIEIHIEHGPNRGKTYLAIFELVGDNLSICYDLDGISYPVDFATEPGTQLMLVNYNRQA